MSTSTDSILRVCREIIAPLVRDDGGELYLVALSDESVALHLAGRYAGCPGTGYVTKSVISPAICAVAPHTRVVVTHGFVVPEGASVVG